MNFISPLKVAILFAVFLQAKGVETIAAVSGLFSIESVEDETHIYDALPAHVAC